MLLAAGADAERPRLPTRFTPLVFACCEGLLDDVKLLSSYGASRTEADGRTADFAPDWPEGGCTDVRDWYFLSRYWTTPLHHLTIIDAARARALLRDGADIHAAKPNVPDAPTPISLAQELRAKGDAPDGSPADLVLQAAQLWSRETHALFPARAREQARTLLLFGHRLSRQPRFAGKEQALMDVWFEGVLPHAVSRDEA